MLVEILLILVYLLALASLGYLGYRRTNTDADYLLAGRKTHPFIMAMSYGAAFISTSAIVGFGGVAGMFGMSLLWLTFLNIFVGIFIAFVFLGGRTRRLGHALDAHTFPELLGRRYRSTFIQVFAGLVIFCFIPLYSAAVMIGGCEFISVHFNIPFDVALLIFAVIIAAYVVTGGLKGAMYAEAMQGTIMVVGMAILVVATYWMLGGVGEAHRKLGELTPLVPGPLKAMGHRGWTSMPAFGWGEKGYSLWWIVIGTITMGVGIGVLAQPQLAVRFMTVKSRRELNRALIFGGVFILMMTGVIFVVGSVSNAWFAEHGPLHAGRVVKTIDAEKNQAILQPMVPKENPAGGEFVWVDKPKSKPIPVVLADLSGKEGWDVPESETLAPLPPSAGRTIALVQAGGADKIIPTYITEAMPKWFGVLFMLALLAAAMSTLSGQFHALGTAIGRDVYEQVTGRSGRSMRITRVGILLGILLAVTISHFARGQYFIARATAIFFGLCASTFLPAYVGGLFFKRVTKSAAIASMIVGFLVTAFWLLLVKAKEASALGLVQFMTDGKPSILADSPNWPVVDPILVALPISLVVMIVVTLLTRSSAPAEVKSA